MKSSTLRKFIVVKLVIILPFAWMLRESPVLLSILALLSVFAGWIAVTLENSGSNGGMTKYVSDNGPAKLREMGMVLILSLLFAPINAIAWVTLHQKGGASQATASIGAFVTFFIAFFGLMVWRIRKLENRKSSS